MFDTETFWTFIWNCSPDMKNSEYLPNDVGQTKPGRPGATGRVFVRSAGDRTPPGYRFFDYLLILLFLHHNNFVLFDRVGYSFHFRQYRSGMFRTLSWFDCGQERISQIDQSKKLESRTVRPDEKCISILLVMLIVPTSVTQIDSAHESYILVDDQYFFVMSPHPRHGHVFRVTHHLMAKIFKYLSKIYMLIFGYDKTQCISSLATNSHFPPLKSQNLPPKRIFWFFFKPLYHMYVPSLYLGLRPNWRPTSKEHIERLEKRSPKICSLNTKV